METDSRTKIMFNIVSILLIIVSLSYIVSGFYYHYFVYLITGLMFSFATTVITIVNYCIDCQDEEDKIDYGDSLLE